MSNSQRKKCTSLGASVSVVIPLFNKRDTIRRALKSILSQTFRDFEIIVVDDGSRDGSAEVVTEFGDSRIVLHAQENSGPGVARNAGLARAQGEFITFLDADDEWDPAFLATALECLLRHPECGVFTAGYRVCMGGRSFRGGRVSPEGPSRLQPDSSPAEAAACLADFHACSAVYRTDLVRACGGHFAHDRCTFGEDVWLWIQVRLRAPIYRHPAELGRYHMDASELGFGSRSTHLPIEPVFIRAADLRRECPPEMQRPFALWLGQHALRAGFHHVADGCPDRARWLLEQVAETRLWPVDRLRLLTKINYPRLWSICKMGTSILFKRSNSSIA